MCGSFLIVFQDMGNTDCCGGISMKLATPPGPQVLLSQVPSSSRASLPQVFETTSFEAFLASSPARVFSGAGVFINSTDHTTTTLQAISVFHKPFSGLERRMLVLAGSSQAPSSFAPAKPHHHHNDGTNLHKLSSAVISTGGIGD